MSKIIVINGMATSGKSTFVSLCHEINQKVIETSTIDFIKQVALYAGWNGEKDDLGRRLLSDIKDALEKYNDIPNKRIDEFINKRPDNIIFVNAREPHNVQYYKNKYNAISLLITNPNTPNINTNHADKNVFEYNYDYIIVNDGTLADLKNKAKKFLKTLDLLN